jgi:hypothetical protein
MSQKKMEKFIIEAQPRCHETGWVEHGYYSHSQWIRTDKTKCPGCQDCRERRVEDGE